LRFDENEADPSWPVIVVRRTALLQAACYPFGSFVLTPKVNARHKVA
jgi:hypothetical protein